MFKPKVKMVNKRCELEGCDIEFVGSITSKYCTEHRKSKYRKVIDKEKIEKKKELRKCNNNQIIKHSFNESKVIQGTCQLEGCGKSFEILLIHNTYIYPKYCPEHRNEFKRERFLKYGSN